MSYRLSMAVDSNLCLEIEEDDFSDLLALFEKMGGDREWLVNTAKSSVAASLHGEAVRAVTRSMNGSVIADVAPDAEEEDASSASSSRAGSANGRSTADGGQTARPSKNQDDPWATGPTDDDPWGEDKPAQKPAQRSSQGRPASSGQSTTKDKFDREWTVGLPEAPECYCEERAARVKAKSKAGKWFTTWKCAKGAGDNYREKCDFSEFPD